MSSIAVKSKAQQVQDYVRQMIRTGEFRPGQRLPPGDEFAHQLNVSPMTLNRALAGLESEALLDRAPGRGTRVRTDVSRGGVATVFSMHLMHEAYRTPYFDVLAERLTQRLGGVGFDSGFILGRGRDRETFSGSIEGALRSWQRLAGVIATASLGPIEQALEARGTPTIHLSPQGDWRYAVVNDHQALGAIAAERLVRRGCRRIGVIDHEHRPAAKPAAWMTHRGVQRVLAAHDLALADHHCAFGCYKAEHGAAALRRLWQQRPADRPDGLVIGDEVLAVGVGQAVRELGIQVPDELAIVSHASGGAPIELPLAFTRCQFDIDRICRAVVGLLGRIAAHRAPQKYRVRIRPRLVPADTA